MCKIWGHPLINPQITVCGNFIIIIKNGSFSCNEVYILPLGEVFWEVNYRLYETMKMGCCTKMLGIVFSSLKELSGHRIDNNNNNHIIIIIVYAILF